MHIKIASLVFREILRDVITPIVMTGITAYATIRAAQVFSEKEDEKDHAEGEGPACCCGCSCAWCERKLADESA